MTRRSGSWLVIAIGLLILLVATPSFGQEKQKFSWTAKPENTKYTFQHTFEIPDVAGHVLRVLEIRRTWPEGGGPSVDGQKVAEEISRGVADLIAGNGSTWGYFSVRYESGYVHFGEWQNTVQTVVNPDRTRRSAYVGTAVGTGGTGKLKGLKSLTRYSGEVEFDAEGKATRISDHRAEGEYWFDK